MLSLDGATGYRGYRTLRAGTIARQVTERLQLSTDGPHIDNSWTFRDSIVLVDEQIIEHTCVLRGCQGIALPNCLDARVTPFGFAVVVEVVRMEPR